VNININCIFGVKVKTKFIIMNFNELVNSRYSVRKFTAQEVKNETIESILETARKAPSAVNFQPYKVYIVKSDEKLKQIKECYHRDWINAAPVILVITGVHDMAWKRGQDGKDHTDIDAAIFIDHITLQSADLGLGTCWVCNFDVMAITDALALNADEEPIALIPLGYPQNEEAPAKKRKGIDEIAVWV
jgi:nitroreductase